MGCACSQPLEQPLDQPLSPKGNSAGDSAVQYQGAWTVQPVADKEKRSWAKAAGRTSGPDGYRFGDGTRACVGALRGKEDRGWKEAAGRTNGKEGYRFGDFTRVAVSNLFGDKHTGQGAGMGVMPKPEPLFHSMAEVAADNSPSSVLDPLWLGFYNATYAVGRLSLGAGELSVDAVEDAEPSVLIGLPALAALECAIRSAAASKDGRLVGFDGKHVGRTALSAGAAVDRARARPAQAATDALALFDTVLELAQRVRGCRLSAGGLASLRARALAVSGSDTRAGGALEPSEDAEVNGLVALSQSVATRLSQMPRYKKAFNKVLLALADERRHEADMLHMMAQAAV